MEDKNLKTVIQRSDLVNESMPLVQSAPACLVLLMGDRNQIGRTWKLGSAFVTIGRAATCEVVIDEPSVSGRHARLVNGAHGDMLTDLGSTNQTFVNGVPLIENVPQLLQNNDMIKMGGVLFKYLARGNIESVSISETFDRSYLDALTRVYNRGALTLQGREFFNRAIAYNLPLGIASLDIDFFKKVNDTYGHAAGDYVLVEFAQLVKEKYRSKDDFLARAGGEEFVLMVCRRASTQAIVQLESLRRAVQTHRFEFQGKVIPVTVSIGLAMLTAEDNDWEAVLIRSDRALYQAKTAGRNRLCVAP